MKLLRLLPFLSLPFLINSTTPPTKIACIGDSITFGATIKNRKENCYPNQLQKLLGNDFLVQNFGKNGATLLKKGDKPYWNQKEFKAAKKFNPDIVIIKLGTNDTKPENSIHKEDFISNYLEMIEVFKELPSKPKIYICLPVPAFSTGNFKITNKVLVDEIIPRVKQVIEKSNVDSINLYNSFVNDEDLFPDKIHPNKEGAKKMAEIIYERLKQDI